MDDIWNFQKGSKNLQVEIFLNVELIQKIYENFERNLNKNFQKDFKDFQKLNYLKKFRIPTFKNFVKNI